MKALRVIAFALVICILPFSCFAAVDSDSYWYFNAEGNYIFDYDGYYYAVADDLVNSSGVSLDVQSYWVLNDNGNYSYDYDRFLLDYNALINVVDTPNIDSEVVDNSNEVEVNESVLSDILEDDQPSVDEELETFAPESAPMVYTVNDLRSSGVSVFSDSASDEPITISDLFPSGTIFLSLDNIFIIDGVAYQGSNLAKPTNNLVTDTIVYNYEYEYFYFSSNPNRKYSFHLKAMYTSGDISSIPVFCFKNWWATDFNICFIDNTAVGDIEQLAFKSSYNSLSGDVYTAKYTLDDGSFVECPVEVDYTNKVVFIPELNIWVDEHFQVYYSNPVSSAVIPDDSSTSSPSVLSGLKAVIRSIFGAYEPVTTTDTVVQTVDGVTSTTLLNVVADGAAGVDYEYIAGVLLFGIMLFCLFRLLGGILS